MEVFSKFGHVVDIYVPLNPFTGKSKGVAYVSFETKEEVERCLQVKHHVIKGAAVRGLRLAVGPVQSWLVGVATVLLVCSSVRPRVAAVCREEKRVHCTLLLI